MILGSILGWTIGGLLVSLLIAVLLPHNLRAYWARQANRNLSATVRHEILATVREMATDCPSVQMLRPVENDSVTEDDLIVKSHVGGRPYAEAGDTWPVRDGVSDPIRFLAQVRLSEPSLGTVWQDRLITVFMVFDVEQIVRSYALPTREKFVPLMPPEPLFDCVPVGPVHDDRLQQLRHCQLRRRRSSTSQWPDVGQHATGTGSRAEVQCARQTVG